MAALTSLVNSIQNRLSETTKLRLVGLAKIPLIFYCSPTIEELGEDRARIRIPLNWRTKNHLGSMYFGVLCVGADCAGGIQAWKWMDEVNTQYRREGNPARLGLVFKDFSAKFLKRPTSDVVFECQQGAQIRALIDAARTSGERVEQTLNILAFCAKNSQNLQEREEVAQFSITLSLKLK